MHIRGSRQSIPMMSTHTSAGPPNKSGVPHEIRTSAEPRQNALYPVRLSHIELVNPTIRLLRFTVPPENIDNSNNHGSIPSIPSKLFTFLPGQWLDVHIPTLRDAGGFTITSTPREASPESSSEPYIELAVQASPSNPAAAWLWRPENEVLGAEVQVRVGGSFIWPPPTAESGIPLAEIRKIIFVAGGVGINPLMSMISHIHNTRSGLHPSTEVHLLYATRIPSASTLSSNSGTSKAQNLLNQILFLPRLREIVHVEQKQQQEQKTGVCFQPLDVRLYLTNLSSHRGTSAGELEAELRGDISVYNRRIIAADLQDLIGSNRVERAKTICNVCGPPRMTDEFVEVLKEIVGDRRVFYEKWW
ncbi:hypothetical protein CISG_05483 [Coccidioides immitis RMSCC 3703]|nr:hypothetical protein CIRG_00620 [Coccidioides immitis RMSCC 2394]KMU75998.1 hypothetical protein CISG_05483 [Coccidioides immitis RMSCC 3703]